MAPIDPRGSRSHRRSSGSLAGSTESNVAAPARRACSAAGLSRWRSPATSWRWSHAGVEIARHQLVGPGRVSSMTSTDGRTQPLRRHNARFAVPAADAEPASLPWPDGLSSAAVFCFHDPRRVGRDSMLSWPGGDLALPRRSDGRSRAGRTVILQERLDGGLSGQPRWPVRSGPTRAGGRRQAPGPPAQPVGS